MVFRNKEKLATSKVERGYSGLWLCFPETVTLQELCLSDKNKNKTKLVHKHNFLIYHL